MKPCFGEELSISQHIRVKLKLFSSSAFSLLNQCHLAFSSGLYSVKCLFFWVVNLAFPLGLPICVYWRMELIVQCPGHVCTLFVLFSCYLKPTVGAAFLGQLLTQCSAFPLRFQRQEISTEMSFSYTQLWCSQLKYLCKPVSISHPFLDWFS